MTFHRWAVCVVVLFSSLKLFATNNPTVNQSRWRPVGLSFRPYSIAANDGGLWICGLDETIAVSHDKGATWQVVHRQQDGEILLDIAFVDRTTGHAAGTGGLMLTTTDGGQTWSAHRGASTIQHFAFSTVNNGIAEIDGQIDLTSDGGSTWQPVAVMQTDPRVKPFSQVESVASLSPSHFLIALHQDQGENIMLSTIDGGKTWTPTHIANTFAGTLISRNEEYWAFGIEYLGREHNPGGGYSAAVTLRSRDGQTWEHGIRASTEFDGCTAQACYLRYGVLEDLYGKEERVWSLPQNSSINAHWAMVGDTVCAVDADLKCGKAIPSAAPQPRPESGGQYIPIGRSQLIAEGCLECNLSEVPAPPSLRGRGAMVKGIAAEFTVERDGTVTNVHITGSTPASINEALASQISQWVMVPAHVGATTATRQERVDLNLLCYPQFPGLTGTPSCSVVSAASMASHLKK